MRLTLAIIALCLLAWLAHDIETDCGTDIACAVSEGSPG